MNEEAIRKAFEAWIAKDCGDLSTFGTGKNVHYVNSAVNNAWTGWQAATRAAAPVWLPIAGAPMDGTEVLVWREDCGQFIASYTHPAAMPLTQDELDAMDEETLFANDWFTQRPHGARMDGSEAPTHYMPLPAEQEAKP